MAQKRTKSSRYQSRYAKDCWVTPAQYIAELICEKIAKQTGKDLPYRFWNTSTWKRTFLYQVQLANSLLKVYSHKAVVKALGDRRMDKLRSLNAQFMLDPIIKEYEEQLSKTVPESPTIEIANKQEPVRPTFVQKRGTIAKLGDL